MDVNSYFLKHLECGFLTSKGEFVNKVDAHRIAHNADQLMVDPSCGLLQDHIPIRWDLRRKRVRKGGDDE